MAAGVEAVVELADDEQMAWLPRDLVRLRFPLSDGGQNGEWLVRLAAHSVAALLRDSVPTLVCCGCGLNRSLCVVAGAIAVAEGRSFDEALIEVADAGPADVSPGLLAEFRAVLSS
ncbi:MAG: protein phosphatase [Planctomycetaceae bacterium]